MSRPVSQHPCYLRPTLSGYHQATMHKPAQASQVLSVPHAALESCMLLPEPPKANAPVENGGRSRTQTHRTKSFEITPSNGS